MWMYVIFILFFQLASTGAPTLEEPEAVDGLVQGAVKKEEDPLARNFFLENDGALDKKVGGKRGEREIERDIKREREIKRERHHKHSCCFQLRDLLLKSRLQNIRSMFREALAKKQFVDWDKTAAIVIKMELDAKCHLSR